MDLTYNMYLERAENELNLAIILEQISSKQDLQENFKGISRIETYYSGVIQHSYYSIFYLTKAYLILKGFKISAPNEHKKTYDRFKLLEKKKVIDKELLEIYENALIKAEELVSIFSKEKKKRSNFTYQRLSQSNKAPALDSINSLKVFKNHLIKLCQLEIEKQGEGKDD